MPNHEPFCNLFYGMTPLAILESDFKSSLELIV